METMNLVRTVNHTKTNNMPNTEKWYNQGEFTEYLNCEISDFKTGRCSDEIEVPEYRIEAILAHHRELIVKEIRGEIEKNTDRYKNFETMDEILCLPCLQENE